MIVSSVGRRRRLLRPLKPKAISAKKAVPAIRVFGVARAGTGAELSALVAVPDRVKPSGLLPEGQEAVPFEAL